MGFREWLFGRKKEERAEETGEVGGIGIEATLLAALFGDTGMTKKKMLEIPMVMSCIEKMAGTIARLPIRLYRREKDGKVTEIKDDARVRMLNIETGDTLNTTELIKALIEDYYLGKGGYAYIEREWGEVKRIHYVDEEKVSVIVGTDPIYKDYIIQVNGKSYLPGDFLKIHRRTRDGASGMPIWKERPLLFAIAYTTMLFEKAGVQSGGNKKGFIESENRLSKDSMDAIRENWKNVYSNNTESVVVLNSGVKFKETSNTSVEMQLYENKEANGTEICETFGFSAKILRGGATKEDRKEFLDAVAELVNTIETALDNDLLQAWERETMFFAFDMKELTRGDIKERYEAYEIAVKNNFMQVDEVREKEDMAPLGFNMIMLGLDTVLLDPKTGEIYTANTNATANLHSLGGGENNEDRGEGRQHNAHQRLCERSGAGEPPGNHATGADE